MAIAARAFRTYLPSSIRNRKTFGLENDLLGLGFGSIGIPPFDNRRCDGFILHDNGLADPDGRLFAIDVEHPKTVRRGVVRNAIDTIDEGAMAWFPHLRRYVSRNRGVRARFRVQVTVNQFQGLLCR